MLRIKLDLFPLSLNLKYTYIYIYMYITRETRILKIRSKNYKRNKISSNDEIWSINEPKSVIRSYFLSRYEKFFSPFSRV